MAATNANRGLTSQSTGPARKAAQAGNFQRWASQGGFGMLFAPKVFFGILLFVVAPSGCADGRPMVRMMDYHNITLKTLVSTYRHAYISAGFRFQKETRRGSQSSDLAFTFPLSGSQHDNRKAGASIVIFAERLNANGQCSPCRVYRETLGVFSNEYEGLEYINTLRIIHSADAKANAYVRKELGKSLEEMSLGSKALGGFGLLCLGIGVGTLLYERSRKRSGIDSKSR